MLNKFFYGELAFILKLYKYYAGKYYDCFWRHKGYWGNNIKNFTRNGKRRMDIVVGISYSDSIDDAFKILQGVAENESRLMTDPAPQVMVASMADSAVNIQLRAWATNENYWSAYWDLNKQVKEAIEAAGLTIPFPQRTLHIIENSSSK